MVMLTGPQITEIMYMFCCCLFLDSFLCVCYFGVCFRASLNMAGVGREREKKEFVFHLTVNCPTFYQ